MQQFLLEKRLELLESKLAFQEVTIDKLNNTVIKHELEITRLMGKIRLLQFKLKASVPLLIADSSEETPPPHY